MFGLFPTPALKLTQIIQEHLQKYNGNLKEISLSTDDVSDLHEDTNYVLIKFFLTLGKLHRNTNFQYKSNLNDLCKINETEDVKVNRTTCRSILSGIVKFVGDPVMSTNRIGLCTNLHALEIIVNLVDEEGDHHPHVSSTYLAFMNQLKKLNYMKIKDEGKEIEDRLLSAEIFADGIPSLSTLDFDGEGLGLNSISFPLCFPNLTKLYIRKFSGTLNADFIYDLTNLYQLKSLTLENLKELSDEHLTFKNLTYCHVLKHGKMANVPAITSLKGLRRLHIIDCNKLTDDSLVNGLALCNGLERITLYCSKGEKFTHNTELTAYKNRKITSLKRKMQLFINPFGLVLIISQG